MGIPSFYHFKPFLLTAFTFLAMASVGHAQSVKVELKNADFLILKGKDNEAIKIYKEIIQSNATQSQALAKLSILMVRKGERQKKNKKRKELYKFAHQFALTALKNNPNYVPAAYAYAFVVYNQSLHLGVKDKIKGLREVKDYLDRILLLDSSYAKAWYLYGRWNMAFNDLNFAERAAVKVLFGGMPKAGAAGAISYFKHCEKLKPSFIRNYYYLAGALHAEGKDLKAIVILKKAIHLRPILKDDRAYQKRCNKMIQSLK